MIPDHRFQFRDHIRHHARIMKRKSNVTRTTRSSHRPRFFNKSKSVITKHSVLSTTRSSQVSVSSRTLGPSATASLASRTMSSNSNSTPDLNITTVMSTLRALTTSTTSTPFSSHLSSPIPSTSSSISNHAPSASSSVTSSPILSTSSNTSTDPSRAPSISPSIILASASNSSSTSSVISYMSSGPTSSTIPSSTSSANSSMTSDPTSGTNSFKGDRLFVVTYKAFTSGPSLSADFESNTTEEPSTHSSEAFQNESLKAPDSNDMPLDMSVNGSNLVTLENNGGVVLFKSSLIPQTEETNMSSDSPTARSSSTTHEVHSDGSTDTDSVTESEISTRSPSPVSENHDPSEKGVFDPTTDPHSEKTEWTSVETSIHAESISDHLKTTSDEPHSSEHNTNHPPTGSAHITNKEESSDKIIFSKTSMDEYTDQITTSNPFTSETTSVGTENVSTFSSSSLPVDNVPSSTPLHHTFESKISQPLTATPSMNPQNTHHASSSIITTARKKGSTFAATSPSVTSSTSESPWSDHNKHSSVSSSSTKHISIESAKPSIFSSKEFTDSSLDQNSTDFLVTNSSNFLEKKMNSQTDDHSKVSGPNDQTTQSNHLSTDNSATSLMAHSNSSENESTIQNDSTSTSHLTDSPDQGSSSNSVTSESYSHDTFTKTPQNESPQTSSGSDRETGLVTNEHTETTSSHGFHSKNESVTDHSTVSDKPSSHNKFAESTTHPMDSSKEFNDQFQSIHDTTSISSSRKTSYDSMKTSSSDEYLLSSHTESGSDGGLTHIKLTNSDSSSELDFTTNHEDVHSKISSYTIQSTSSSESEHVTLSSQSTNAEEKSSSSEIGNILSKIPEDSTSSGSDSENSDPVKVGHRVKLKLPKLEASPSRTRRTRRPMATTMGNFVPPGNDQEKFEPGKGKDVLFTKQPQALPDSFKTNHAQYASPQTMPTFVDSVSPSIEMGKLEPNRPNGVPIMNSPKFSPDSMNTQDATFASMQSVAPVNYPVSQVPYHTNIDHGKENNLLVTKVPKVPQNSLRPSDAQYWVMTTTPSFKNPFPTSNIPESSEEKNSLPKSSQILSASFTKPNFPNMPSVSMPQLNNPFSQSKNMGKNYSSKQASNGGISMPDIVPESMPTIASWKNPFSSKNNPEKVDSDQGKFTPGMTMPDVLPNSLPSWNNMISQNHNLDNTDSGKEKNNWKMTMPSLSNPLSSNSNSEKSGLKEEKDSGGMKMPHSLPDSVTMADITPDSMSSPPAFNNLVPSKSSMEISNSKKEKFAWTVTMSNILTSSNPFPTSNNLQKSNYDKQTINGGMQAPSINYDSMSTRPSWNKNNINNIDNNNPNSQQNIPGKFDSQNYLNLDTTPRKNVLSKVSQFVDPVTKPFSGAMNMSSIVTSTLNNAELGYSSFTTQANSDLSTRYNSKVPSRRYQDIFQSSGSMKTMPTSGSFSVDFSPNSNLIDKNSSTSHVQTRSSTAHLTSKGPVSSSLGTRVTLQNQYHSTIKSRNHDPQISISTPPSSIDGQNFPSSMNSSKLGQHIRRIMSQSDKVQAISANSSIHDKPTGNGSFTHTVSSSSSVKAETSNLVTSRLKLSSLDDHGPHSSFSHPGILPKERILSLTDADDAHTDRDDHGAHTSTIYNNSPKEPVLKESDNDHLIPVSKGAISSGEETDLSDSEGDLN